MIRNTLLSTLALSATAIAGDAYEKAVPADVWGFLECDDVEQTIADFKASDLGRCLMDPSMDAVREDFWKTFSEMRSKIAQDAGADPFAMLEKIEGGAALVFFDSAASDPDFFKQRVSIPRIGFLLGGGDHAGELAQQFSDLLKKEIDEGKGSQETREIEGVSVTIVTEKAKSENDKPAELAYAVVGSTFVLTVQPQKDGDRDEIEQLIQGLSGKLENPLSKKADFEASLGANPSGSGLRAYVDLGTIVREGLESEKNVSDSEMARKLGVDKIGRAAMRGKVDSKTSEYSIEVRIEGETPIGTILSKFFPAGPMNLLSRLSSDVERGSTVHLDIGAGFEALLSEMEKIDPETAKTMQSELDSMSTDKFNLRRDVLDPLGNEIAIAYSKVKDETEALPGTEEDPHSVAVAIKIDDGKTIETALDAYIQENGLAAIRERSEFDGKILWTLPASILPVKLHYTIQPDLMVISASSELLKDILRRGGESKLPSLATDPAFASTLAALGKGPFSVIYATDAADSLKANFGLLALFMMGLGKRDSAMSIEQLDKEKLASFTSGRDAVVTRISTDGIFVHSLHRGEKK